jgi:magnesium transporter
MNEVVKTLTLISTVMLPLSFIAGVYGMNFKTEKAGNMPELSWPYGYWFALGLMAIVTIGIVLWFRRKGYIGGRNTEEERLERKLETDTRRDEAKRRKRKRERTHPGL